MSLRKIIFSFICAVALINCAFAERVFYDTDHKAIQRSQLKGTWIIVNYWAEWCPTCMNEIPELNRFNQIKNKNVLLLGVNYDQPALEDLKRSANRSRISFPLLTANPSSAWRLGDVDAIPATFIINPEGRVVKKIVGENTAESLMNTLQRLQAREEV